MRKRNAPERKVTPSDAMTTFAKAIQLISLAGIEVEWANYKGNFILTIKGIVLSTNRENRTAHFVRSSEYVSDVIQQSAEKGDQNVQ